MAYVVSEAQIRLNLLFAGRERHISSMKSNRAILIMSNNSRGFLAFTAASVLQRMAVCPVPDSRRLPLVADSQPRHLFSANPRLFNHIPHHLKGVGVDFI